MPLRDIQQELTVCVAPDDPVKLAVLTITNESTASKRLSVFGYVEWWLGPPRLGENRFVTTSRDAANGAIFARNTYGADFRDRVGFYHASEDARSFTCDRAEFVGRNRTGQPSGGAPSPAIERTIPAPDSIPAPPCTSR